MDAPAQAAAIRAMPLGKQVERCFELRQMAWTIIESSVRADQPRLAPHELRSLVVARMRRGTA
ncbi:MAG: hypothetical protein K2Q09_00720 [Phycisphaerales bacterium]|nr:hypothetical protein [Phycisphaerales bacterium]